MTPQIFARKSNQSPPRYVVQYSCKSSIAPLIKTGHKTAPIQACHNTSSYLRWLRRIRSTAYRTSRHTYRYEPLCLSPRFSDFQRRRFKEREIDHHCDNRQRDRIFLQVIQHHNYSILLYSEHLPYPFNTGGKDVYFFFCVIKRERGANRPLDSQILHQRLGAMMSGTDRNPQTIQQHPHYHSDGYYLPRKESTAPLCAACPKIRIPSIAFSLSVA